MQWNKIGLVFCPAGEVDWMYSHASVPIAEHLEGDLFKVYFSSRDKDNRSYTGSVVIDIYRSHSILDLDTAPIIEPGELGAFDDSGAMATWLVDVQGKKFLYYIGWNLGVSVPFRNSIGLAVNDGTGKFIRYAKGPIMDRTAREPHFCSSCCVLKCESTWKMWYLSCVGWSKTNSTPIHKYHIKYAESEDGINWQRNGHVAIDFADKDEYAISRPSVICDKNLWRMWYSVRGGAYTIGYAKSHNGIDWARHDDQGGLSISSQGWDSDMVEYPFVFDHKGDRFMLYNGNGYGKTGFGLAVLE